MDGTAHLGNGRTAAAVEALQRAAELQFCPICALPDLGRAYERAGRPDSALAVYRRYLETPWFERWSSDGEYSGHVLLRVAELSERGGDRSAAIAGYREFAERWRDADPEFQPLVTRARERLAVLGSAAVARSPHAQP